MRYLLRPCLLLALVLLGPSAAATETCDDLWFTRNALIDRAGYCFGSPLGQSLFDNAGCLGKSVTLAPDAKEKVARIQAREALIGCSVNTSAETLDLDDLFVRRQLVDLPVADEFESGCLGWVGPQTLLRAGTDPQSPVVGQILPGDYLSFGHDQEDGWVYVTVHQPNYAGLTSAGWLPDMGGGYPCAAFAG
jgi:hypothetical protein